MKQHLCTFLLMMSILLLFACNGQELPAATLALTPLPTPVQHLPPTFTPPQPFERLFPTFPAVTVTQRPLPDRATNTPIPFGDTTVEVQYIIPALGLNRRLQGSVSSQIILVDENTGEAVRRANQAGVLLQLQSTLPGLLLPVVPAGCDTCVYISYDLPYANQRDEGWLRDPVILASLENYMVVALGPHLPAGTVAGLRRAASPYAPAHTIALTAEGLLYIWLATENEVNLPTEAGPALLEAVANISLAGLNREYLAPCVGSTPEILLLKTAEQERTINLACPEYVLPLSLLPLYAQFDDALAEKLGQSELVLARPPTDFPLRALLDYKRADGARLTLFSDNTAVAQNPAGETFTSTISAAEAITLTNELIAGGAIRTGLNTFIAETTAVTVTATPKPLHSVVIARGPVGVYDGEWFGSYDLNHLRPLNVLLARLLNPAATLETPETLEEIATPAPEATGTAVPDETGTPPASATP